MINTEANSPSQGSAVYARSTRTGTPTVDEQIATCLAAARQNGWDVPKSNVYTDEGSESKMAFASRPGIQALLAEARHKYRGFERVIVYDQQRLSRVAEEMLSVYGELSRCGVSVVIAKSVSRRRSRRPPANAGQAVC